MSGQWWTVFRGYGVSIVRSGFPGQVGKGSAPRPLSVRADDFGRRFDQTFPQVGGAFAVDQPSEPVELPRIALVHPEGEGVEDVAVAVVHG